MVIELVDKDTNREDKPGKWQVGGAGVSFLEKEKTYMLLDGEKWSSGW